jgi:hypothetical protein
MAQVVVFIPTIIFRTGPSMDHHNSSKLDLIFATALKDNRRNNASTIAVPRYTAIITSP